MDGYITQIDSKTATEFILPRHYAGRVPSISIAFGWYHGGKLVAVCTFGKPSTPWLCKGICGDAWASNVYELNRLCRLEVSTVTTYCCDGTHIVYDNRFHEYYSCPICTGKLVKLSGDISTTEVDALVQQAIAKEHKRSKKLF